MGLILDSSALVAVERRGTRIPLSDLLIGVTALELGYSVATINVRHFRLVPGLLVVQL